MKSVSTLIHDEAFRSVLLVMIGFLLAQLNSFFAGRRERKRAVSCALSDLLEIKFQFLALEQIVEQVGNLVGKVPEHEKSQIRVAFDSMLPKWDELHSRYDQSVTTLAGLHPLLAFQLRAKDFIRPTLMFLHSLMGQDPQAAAFFGPILRTKLLAKIGPILDKSILALAVRKSLLCWFKTARLLKRQKRIPDELEEVFESLKIAIEVQKNAGNAAQADAQRTD